jgi:hypothetical protein
MPTLRILRSSAASPPGVVIVRGVKRSSPASTRALTVARGE